MSIPDQDSASILSAQREFLVVCLCAEWCDICRDYRPGFLALAREFPDAGFFWVDIEDNAAWAGDFEVEDFPTIAIQRNQWVLYYGTMLPHHSHLRRTLEEFRMQSAAQSLAYAHANDQRSDWQERCDLRAALLAHLRGQA
jgi:thioredoxin 1